MTGPAFERYVLIAQVTAGLTWIVLFVRAGLAVPDDSSTLDRVFPFALAALALLGTAWVLRRAARRPGAGDPGRPDEQRRAAAGNTGPAGVEAPEPPRLSARGRAELERILRVLAGVGAFAPRVPDPADLDAAVADRGEPPTAFDVLAGMDEATFHRPAFRISDHTARLAFHHDQVEQDEPTLRTHVRDLDALAGDALAVAVHDVAITWTDGDRTAPTRLRLTLDGVDRTLAYTGAVKHLSTALHGEVARALRERGAPVRLAGLASDAGTWFAALSPDVDLDRLNDDLAAPAYERWEWIDEQAP